MPLALLIVPVFSTLAGGLLALRLRGALGILIALSTGLLLGAALLDLLPEAIALERAAGGRAVTSIALAVISFFAFLLSQRLLGGRNGSGARSSSRAWGRFGGGLLVAHSFRDGMAIGLSYAASHPAGYIVAAGIAAHDVGDGVNTILLSTRGQRAEGVDYLLLAADSIAPMAGALLTIWFRLSPSGAAALLAVTAGFFVHMILVELLPQLREDRTPRTYLGGAAAAGVLLIYVATRLVL